MLPTQKSGSHSHGGGGHGHGHSHGGGAPQGWRQLLTGNNLVHFVTVAISVILYYILFAWDSLFINFSVLLIWSGLASLAVATFLRIPRSMWNQFCPRFVFISLVFYFLIR